MAFSSVDCLNVSAPMVLPFVTGGISLLLSILVIPGNFLILLAIYKDPNRELRNPFNLFVGNLALADLLVGLVVLPLSSALHIREGLLIEAKSYEIWTIHVSFFIACTASLLSLAAMTLDRHVALIYPVYYRIALSPKRAFFVSALIWIISIALPLIYFKVGYIMYAFVFSNIAIAVSLFFLFSCLFITRRIGRRNSTLESHTGQGKRGQNGRERRRRNSELQDRLTRVFSLVLIAYLICYGPSCVMVYLMNFCVQCSCSQIHWFRDMQLVFVLMNSSANPFLYSWRLSPFRNALKKLLRCKPRTQNDNSSSLDNIFQDLSTSRNTRSYKNNAIELVSFKITEFSP
ncbi:octopamine receptor beta-2R-like [Nematostella vectensis]|uniref:octopamine receptor beta-2R-like n=1 Tax=Nematostella vectensis TaxID=45351 RepID=UPI0020778D96|nr:octopamine receptor beta-2R-like [Nematostella vectensis]